MNNSINLVQGRKNFDLEKQAKILKIVKIFAFLCLFFVPLISLIFFIITITLPIDTVKKNQQQTLSGISTLHKKLVTFSLVNERLDGIRSLIERRKKYNDLYKKMFNLIPQGLTIDKLLIDGKTFKFSISGKSLLALNDVIDKMIEYGDNNKEISNLVILTLTFIPNSNSYLLTLQADMF